MSVHELDVGKTLFTEPGVRCFGRNLNHESNGQGKEGAQTLQPSVKGKAPPEPTYMYDLIVIGGGPGGIAASLEANSQNKNVGICKIESSHSLNGAFVDMGTTAKKLMQRALLLGHSVCDASHYGWHISPNEVWHEWVEMVKKIQEYIRSLNWGYRCILREKGIVYHNSFVEFVDNHTVKVRVENGIVEHVTSDKIIIDVGGHQDYPQFPGIEYCISSDDLVSLSHSPKKTLVIGESPSALECAGFLLGLGIKVTLMTRSILLRGFDEEMTNKIAKYLERRGVRFFREHCPVLIDKILDGEPGLFKVTSTKLFEQVVGFYNTIIVAVNKTPCTTEMGLKKVGVRLNPKNMKIVCDEKDQTSVNNIFALGDVSDGKPELTPSAIQAGKLLARRLFANSEHVMNYINIPSVMFTPLEYGCVGLSEEDAKVKYGQDDIEVYRKCFMPLETALPSREKIECLAKLVCVKSQNEKVIGFHLVSPNAGKISLGFALSLKLGATKSDFDNSVGIHLTCGEVFFAIDTKRSSYGTIGTHWEVNEDLLYYK